MFADIYLRLIYSGKYIKNNCYLLKSVLIISLQLVTVMKLSTMLGNVICNNSYHAQFEFRTVQEDQPKPVPGHQPSPVKFRESLLELDIPSID